KNSAENIKEGKGDPCRLVGFTMASIRKLVDEGHEVDNGMWRLPTHAETEKYIDSSSNFTAVNGANGRFFGPGASADGTGGEFLPTAGSLTDTVGELEYEDYFGAYWVFSTYNLFGYGTHLHFRERAISMSILEQSSGLSIRCVCQ
ncbi:MAG: hypothetical protein ACRCZZ_10795, partial [Phocaeicola sp.]